MGHIAHLSHLGQYLKIFSLYLLWPLYTISCTGNVLGMSLPGNPTGLYLWLGGEDLNSFRDNKVLPVPVPWDHFVWSWPTYHQMLLDTRNKNMYGLGMGISTVFKTFGHFLYQGKQDHSVWSWPTVTYIPSDATWHKNIYGLGVGISMNFEILGHFLLKGGWDHQVRSWLPYHQMLLVTWSKNIYGLGWEFQQFSRYLGTSCIKRDRTTPYGHDIYTIRWYLTQKTKIYMA
jgi:hypothetical protein